MLALPYFVTLSAGGYVRSEIDEKSRSFSLIRCLMKDVPGGKKILIIGKEDTFALLKTL